MAVALAWGCAVVPGRPAGDVEEGWALLAAGHYTECVTLAREAIAEQRYAEDWRLMLGEAQLATGRYAEARAALTNALEQYSSSLRLRLLAHDVFRFGGDPDAAAEQLKEMDELVRTRPWGFRDPASRVALGRALLLLGIDPRLVLERVFDPVRKSNPEVRAVHLATGELALDKHDFALASKIFTEALSRFPKDAELHYGLARAYAPSERAHMLESLQSALSCNTNHVPSWLLLADAAIDAEDYDEAGRMLGRARAVNPSHPELWAYQAVLAHLRNDPAAERAARDTALRFWKTNPRVDHVIGWKLSQKYRFAEGAEHQRQALQFDPRYLPAQAQLAQDLLRLGEEGEGWQLAAAVADKDNYDVAAFNLVTLRDTMAKFRALTNGNFILRMEPHEAGLYGERALALLERARTRLSAKYAIGLRGPTVVEIFPSPKDFGVRTFGLPDNPGYLGVCFGRVITANSPASQGGRPANWEAVLWHEFAHVVTLQLTQNKLPRWLSEGISVYEERQADPTWGQAMNSRYRAMILDGDLTPIGDLSGAFLSPRSELHLQFAYFQSALVVEFLVDRFGLDALKAILRDLGQGAEINPALEKHTLPLATLERDFAAMARQRAAQWAPGLDWEKPAAEPSGKAPSDEAMDAWAAAHPTNFWALTHRAQRCLADQRWADAKEPLQRLVERSPADVAPENAYALLARVHRALGETNLERQVLSRWAAQSATAMEAYMRLLDLDAAAGDWPGVARNARRLLAVNPLVPQPYTSLARASEALEDFPAAIGAYRALLELDPPNPAEVHYRLARVLHRVGDPAARRHVLQALEEAPRFRDAYRLLLELERAAPGTADGRATAIPRVDHGFAEAGRPEAPSREGEIRLNRSPP